MAGNADATGTRRDAGRRDPRVPRHGPRAASHPDFHRRSRSSTGSTAHRWWDGSRTVTAGSEFHRPRSARAADVPGGCLPPGVLV